VKKITVFFVFVSIGICFLCIPLYADPVAGKSKNNRDALLQSTYTLTMNAQFGMLWGQAEEQVFYNSDSDRLTSQLLWDVKPLWYTGMNLEFSRKDPAAGPGIFSALSVKFGIPGNSGVMEDRDWLTPGGDLTNYSLHNNLSNGTMFLDLLTGLSAPLGQSLVFRFLLGPSYMHLAWTAYDGYYRYSENSSIPLEDSVPPVPLSGAMISYSQDWFLLICNFSVQLFPNRLFSGILFCNAGPVIRFVAKDDHHEKKSGYYDEISGGYTLEPGGEFRFSPMKNFSLVLHFSWRSVIAASHGSSFSRSAGTGDWIFTGNISGGRFQTMDMGIGLEIRL
jgi:outer membrane protease